MSRFLTSAQIVLGHEGGLSDHPNDKGGRTNLGVTQGTLNTARKSITGLPERVDNLTRGQALEIYRKLYWDKSRCSDLPEPIDLLTFDAAINCGTGGAGKMLQRALNRMGASLSVDGSIGPLTTVACREAFASAPWRLIGTLQMERVRWHNSIVARDRSQLTFLHGWLNRIIRNAEEVGV